MFGQNESYIKIVVMVKMMKMDGAWDEMGREDEGEFLETKGFFL